MEEIHVLGLSTLCQDKQDRKASVVGLEDDLDDNRRDIGNLPCVRIAMVRRSAVGVPSFGVLGNAVWGY